MYNYPEQGVALADKHNLRSFTFFLSSSRLGESSWELRTHCITHPVPDIEGYRGYSTSRSFDEAPPAAFAARCWAMLVLRKASRSSCQQKRGKDALEHAQNGPGSTEKGPINAIFRYFKTFGIPSSEYTTERGLDAEQRLPMSFAPPLMAIPAQVLPTITLKLHHRVFQGQGAHVIMACLVRSELFSSPPI